MERCDVAVVGAGLAGLTAAVDLAGRGYRVVVLEARDRVGGRTTGQRMSDGHTIEMGGQWVGPTQDAVLALCDRYGLATYPQYTAGDDLFLWRGQLSRFAASQPRLSGESLVEAGRIKVQLEAMAATLDVDRPWAADRAAEWDSVTMHTWLAASTKDAGALAYWGIIVPAMFAAEPAELSLLHGLFYIASGGMLDMLLGVENGAQERRVVGGSHLISEAMAASLGDAVRLCAPVSAIEHSREVIVRYDGGAVGARRVVVALPPALAGRLRYTPGLPGGRDQLTQQVPMGSVIKFNVLYDRPFWREDGLSGHVSSPDLPLSFVLDNVPHGSPHGVLVGFAEGRHARRLSALTPAQRRATALDCLVTCFGPEAAQPVEYLEKDWSAETFSGGCYGGRLGTGVWTAYGPHLRQPVGAIHWGGSETSAVWNGYMDGAVRSGHRAAAEVDQALSPTESR